MLKFVEIPFFSVATELPLGHGRNGSVDLGGAAAGPGVHALEAGSASRSLGPFP